MAEPRSTARAVADPGGACALLLHSGANGRPAAGHAAAGVLTVPPRTDDDEALGEDVAHIL